MPDYLATIGGVEVGVSVDGDRASTGILIASFNLNEPASRINTIAFDVFDLGGSPRFRPQLDDEVYIYEDDGSSPVTTLFGGVVTSAIESGLVGPNDDPIVTRVEAVDFKGLTEGQIVEETFAAGTTLQAVLETLVTYVSQFGITLDPSQPTGPNLSGEIVWDLKPLPDCLKELAEVTQWVWEIDYSKILRMYAPTAIAAPWNLIEGDGSEIGDVESQPVRQEYYDRVIVRAGTNEVIVVTESYVAGGGGQAVFPLSYPVASHPVDIYRSFFGYVTRDGNQFETLGVSGTAQWAWVEATNSIEREAGAVTAGQTVSITYKAQFPITVESSLSPYTRTRIEVRTDIFNRNEAQALADSLVSAYSAPQHVVRYKTMRPGLRPGMVQTITLPRRDIDGNFLITEITTSPQSGAAPQDSMLRHVTAVGGDQFVNAWRDVYDRWLGGSGVGSGGVASPIVAPGTVADVGQMQFKSVLLDHTQLLALDTTPATVVPATGAGYVNVPLHMTAFAGFSTGYGQAARVRLHYDGHASQLALSNVFVSQQAPNPYMAVCPVNAAGFAMSGGDNKDLVVEWDATVSSGGASDNQMIVTVAYYTVPVSAL